MVSMEEIFFPVERIVFPWGTLGGITCITGHVFHGRDDLVFPCNPSLPLNMLRMGLLPHFSLAMPPSFSLLLPHVSPSLSCRPLSCCYRTWASMWSS